VHGRNKQRRGAFSRCTFFGLDLIHCRIRIKQAPHYLSVSHFSRGVQWRDSTLRSESVEVRSVVDQALDDLMMSVLCCHVQRRRTVNLCGVVHVRPPCSVPFY
jgi:hypothetical protein